MESQSQGLSQSLVGVTLRDTSKGALCMAHALLGFKAIVIPPPAPRITERSQLRPMQQSHRFKQSARERKK